MIAFILSAILLGVALSMDCFAVSITCGLQKTMNRKRGIILALSFAFFQGLFPLVGAIIGNFAKEYIQSIDHWIAFALLAAIGIKMLIEGINFNINEKVFDFTKPSILITLSIATSIDALIVGIGFSFQYTLIEQIITVLVIALCTFIFSALGVIMGKKTCFFKPKLALMLGGGILFSLGLKILLQHLMA